MYRDGVSQEEIARRLGTSQPKISRTLRANGVRTGRKFKDGQLHPQWKGGRIMANGYVQVNEFHLDPDDPNRAMANSQGYIAEHRLVVAQHLGRPLRLDETVHHKNGVKDDNRLENLQLRQGSHGNGWATRCADCGSTNIIGTDLA